MRRSGLDLAVGTGSPQGRVRASVLRLEDGEEDQKVEASRLSVCGSAYDGVVEGGVRDHACVD